ncbi:hypothetical protein C7B65_07265 [Phormidesmis priestleyi ULC007]|uniref:Uncharacterized protein n=2 Tax=Phormidesmis priestleyi TaxID=268141 RepID=A0A2T1DJP7_9CYAN|nr:hypothetical protein C7B65_07265 [Phormidesmis priestleyi ULC007]PZO47131.1 MAG: hypothetical protein DCF14_20730 [Phormidesmis priestleyi]
MTHWSDLLQMHWQLPHDWVVLGQQFKETDIGGDVGRAWSHFVKTGQVWAFLVGLILGYMARALTTYG